MVAQQKAEKGETIIAKKIQQSAKRILWSSKSTWWEKTFFVGISEYIVKNFDKVAENTKHEKFRLNTYRE